MLQHATIGVMILHTLVLGWLCDASMILRFDPRGSVNRHTGKSALVGIPVANVASATANEVHVASQVMTCILERLGISCPASDELADDMIAIYNAYQDTVRAGRISHNCH